MSFDKDLQASMAKMGRLTRAKTAAIELATQQLGTLKRRVVDRKELTCLTNERASKMEETDHQPPLASTLTRANPAIKHRKPAKKKTKQVDPSETSEGSILVVEQGDGIDDSNDPRTETPASPVATRPAHQKGKAKAGEHRLTFLAHVMYPLVFASATTTPFSVESARG